ncbi:hypothetical protein [Thermococcus gorgonarius]|uniref:Uncharacterized protein n=1 Tax=Thermococcus gorgonarius TaxID=71997 RepID=A0A2Z2MH83_THEGO|nr:hypothetical protein [Thermococcus gorgonarius]ASJ01328.1 hypothetical protein A3K92_07450 [Thermococcus gorgonarius]
MKKKLREIFGDDLTNYLELLRAKLAFAEEIYGVKMNYIPLIIEEPIVILDKRDGKIKWLKNKKELTEEELQKLSEKMKRNLESGFVEALLAMNMSCINGPGE